MAFVRKSWEIEQAYGEALSIHNQPVVIIARTVKGKGASMVENQNGWHGKNLDEDQAKYARFW
ncbi:MAG: hypothetical protein RIM23_03325 [Coleofasciculus sp. G3-WIS-01]